MPIVSFLQPSRSRGAGEGSEENFATSGLPATGPVGLGGAEGGGGLGRGTLSAYLAKSIKSHLWNGVQRGR